MILPPEGEILLPLYRFNVLHLKEKQRFLISGYDVFCGFYDGFCFS